jgi:hypothetical protein
MLGRFMLRGLLRLGMGRSFVRLPLDGVVGLMGAGLVRLMADHVLMRLREQTSERQE